MIDGFGHEPPLRRALLRLLTWTWCLPTTLVGLVAGLFAVAALEGRPAPYRGATVVRTARLRGVGGVCLGPVILVPDTADAGFVAHEWGHFRQHLRLGPLYLPFVGIPSFTHAIWHRLSGGRANYYHFWTEAWADALGGVYAGHRHRHAHWTGYAFGPVLVLIVVALTLRAFGPALRFPFTDADALVDVAWAARPLSNQLLVPLTGGLGGANANFWRPAAMLQYWALRRLFGEAPMGWHAWDLGLHMVASGLVGVLALALSRACGRADRGFALLAAALFVAHPLAEEVVPAVARNLDLLLGVGFFGALGVLLRLIEARRTGPAVGLQAAFLGLLVLALGAKEAGVLLLPVAAVWIGVLRDDLPVRARVLEATKLLAPGAVVAVVWLVVRAHVLGGVGGYYDASALGEGGHLAYALSRGFLEPLAPSLSVPLHPLEGAAGAVLTAAIWGALLVGLRRHTRLLILAAAVYLPWIFLLGFTGTYSRRVLYVPTFALVLVLARATLDALAALRARRAASSIAGAVGVAGLLLVWAHGSPAFARYEDWDVSARATAPLLDPVVWAPFPDGATVYVVDRPARVDVDPRRYRLWSKRKSLANAAASYSIQAWVDEHVARGLKLRNASAIVPEGPPERFAATLALAGDTLTVTRPPASRTITASPPLLASESGDTLTLTPDPTADQPLHCLVWDPQTPHAVVLFHGNSQIWPAP